MWQVGATEVHVGRALYHGVEARWIDCRHHAAELESDATLESLGEPGHQLERLRAADQTKIANHPWPLALLRALQRFRPVGADDRWMQFVLEQEPRAAVFLDRCVVPAVKARRGQD